MVFYIRGLTAEECDLQRGFYSSNDKGLVPDELFVSSNGGGSIFSNDAEKNPAFHQYAKVLVDYCSGDLYAGDIDVSISQPILGTQLKTRLFFHGQRILKLLIEGLQNGRLLHQRWLQQEGEDPASKVKISDLVLYGSSAGAIGILNNAWRFREAFGPAVTRI